MLQKLARKIEELEEKLGGVGVEKRVAGETSTPSSGKPSKYPFPCTEGRILQAEAKVCQALPKGSNGD